MSIENPTPREVLAGLLIPLLPEGWQIITAEVDPGVMDKTTVFIRQKRISRHELAPQSMHLIEFVVSIAAPHTPDLAAAEDRLDDDLNTLLHAIEESANILWTVPAEKVLVTETNLGYDLPLSLVSVKREPTTPESE